MNGLLLIQIQVPSTYLPMFKHVSNCLIYREHRQSDRQTYSDDHNTSPKFVGESNNLATRSVSERTLIFSLLNE